MVGTSGRCRRAVGLALALTAVAPSGAAAAGATIAVAAGGDLQAALEAAAPGDTVTLAPGAVYVGNFVLPAKHGDDYITIRSAAPDSALPGPGVRIGPGDTPSLPVLRSPNSQPAMATAPGAHHYRLAFLAFQANAGGAGNILALGDGSRAQRSLDQVPHHLVVDRVYMQGDPVSGQKRGIALNSAYTSVLNSYIAGIRAVGQDSQAICGWNGPGPFLIDNNYLEAAGENVMFGGSDPAIPGLVPSDITITRNHVTKSPAWRGGPWVVKNLFELKNAQRVSVEHNVFEHNWAAAQSGYAILLKSVNQDGGAPWSVVRDVTFAHNIVRKVSSAINILGRDTSHAAVEASRIAIRHNLFEDVSGARYGGSGRFLLINGATAVTIDHNTVFSDGSTTVFADGRPTLGFVFSNNIIEGGAWTIKGSGAGEGVGTVARYFPGGLFSGSVFTGANPAIYPQGNFFPPVLDAIGFVDLAGGNYRLAGNSPYRGAATDGADVGCDIDALGAGSGVAPTPLPTSPAVPPPDAPLIVSAAANGQTVSLSWRPSTTGSPPLGYVLEAGSSSGASDAATLTTTSTSMVATGVAPGTYHVALRAVGAGGQGPRSAEVVLTVGSSAASCAGPPLPPTGLAASVSGTRVVLSWAPPAGDCPPLRYVLLVGSAPGQADILQVPIDAGTRLDANAPAGTYFVRLLAETDAGLGGASNEVVVTVTP